MAAAIIQGEAAITADRMPVSTYAGASGQGVRLELGPLRRKL